MGPKKKINSKENELSASRKKYTERPSPAAINSGAKTKDNSPRKLSSSATTARSHIKPPMQSKGASGPSTTYPISITKNGKNNDSLIIGTNNQAANSKPQKKQASRIPASNSNAKNRNINTKVQEPKSSKVHSPNKFQSRGSTLPPVHPVAFIKDDSKSFKQNNQSKSGRFSTPSTAKVKMEAQPLKTSSFGQSNASKSTNPVGKCIHDTINNVGLKNGAIDPNIPVKDLGIINSESELNDNQHNDEFNVIFPATKKDESPIKLSAKKLEPITFNGNIINKGFESLDDLKLENLEAYISACKSPPFSRNATIFESQSLIPRLQNGLLKSSTLPNDQNEILKEKTDKRKDELDTEDAITVSTIENCTSELEFNGLEVALPQTYESPPNTVKDEDSNSMKMNPQTLNAFKPHQFDILGLKWGLENKRLWEPNSIDKTNTENPAMKDPDRDGSASSDSDKKTFTWTPEVMISFETNKTEFSKQESENESPICQNSSHVSNNDTLYSLILSEGEEKEEPENNSTIIPIVIPTKSELAECKKTSISHSKGDVTRVNEAFNKSCSKEFNVDCEMGNKVISDTSQLSEPISVPEISDGLSGDDDLQNIPGTDDDDSSKIEELSTQSEMSIDKSEDDNNYIVSSTKDVFEDVNTLDVLNLAPNCNLGLANSDDEEYLKYITNELEITDDDSHNKLNLGDDDEFSVESEEYYVPVSNTESVWIDYKRQIKPRTQDDSPIDENKYDNWTVEEEDDDSKSSNDGNSFVFLEADDREWIKTEKELVDLKSLLEECSMEVQNAAHEIKNLSSKHVRNKLQNGNTISKTKMKKKCDNMGIRSELLEISDLMDNLTEPHYDQEYYESPSEKLSYNRRIYCHEEDLDYYSMSSSDEDCKIESSKDQTSSPSKKSFLSFGKSCNNKKKKSSKILLSFFNIFK